MSYSGLADTRAILNTLGCFMQEPGLVEDVDHPLSVEDFEVEDFYKILYVAIYNLEMQGMTKIDEFAIDSYLSSYDEQYKIFQGNNGLEYLSSAKGMASLENFDYFYHRMRKFSLLRYYEKKGLDTRFIYNPSAPSDQLNKEEEKFENYTEQDIVETVESTFVLQPQSSFCQSELSEGCQAGEGLLDLIEELHEAPAIGVPLADDGIGSVTRGARTGCLYLRSLLQGQGKTRLAIGDARNIAIPYVYDVKKGDFIHTGWSEPTLFLTTEMAIREIQTPLLASVAKVNEDHILRRTYEPGEYERVLQAAEYIKQSPIFIEQIYEFGISDIINIIKRYHRQYGVRYVFFDYIWMSVKAMGEANRNSGMRLGEHQILLDFATELKALAQKLDIFIFSASQLKPEAIDAHYKNQNLLAGAKSLANKLDVGIIQMKPTKAELKRLEPVIRKSAKVGIKMPNFASWCYKVRGGQLSNIIIWSYYDLGTMTEEPLFVTDFDFTLIDVDITKIENADVVVETQSHYMTDDDFKEDEIINEEPTVEESEAVKEVDPEPQKTSSVVNKNGKLMF
ncbi:replicative DNA helicase [Lachnospiraceae bacterium KHCPX20]|nr:replicative DNA helicase [Lachnospiraceae bacterium KHCPX20]